MLQRMKKRRSRYAIHRPHYCMGLDSQKEVISNQDW